MREARNDRALFRHCLDAAVRLRRENVRYEQIAVRTVPRTQSIITVDETAASPVTTSGIRSLAGQPGSADALWTNSGRRGDGHSSGDCESLSGGDAQRIESGVWGHSADAVAGTRGSFSCRCRDGSLHRFRRRRARSVFSAPVRFTQWGGIYSPSSREWRGERNCGCQRAD
jgi:hypothetical protein